VLRARIDDARRSAIAIAGRRDEALADVQAVEERIAAVEAGRREVRARVKTERREAGRLSAELGRLRDSAAESRLGLARFLRARYRMNGTSTLRTLLSLEQPAEMTRMAGYHRYLSAWQEERIAEFDSAAARVEEAVAAVNASRARLAALEARLEDDRRRLEDLGRQRRDLVAALERSLGDQRKRIDSFEREASRLEILVRELATAAPAVSTVEPPPATPEAAAQAPAPTPALASARTPFGDMRGRLGWPAAAGVLHEFGEPRQGGGLPWKGVMLDVPAGETVRAVYDGTVVFADWFPAFGLLLIIDHGDGYMSLYAHLGHLLKAPGDRVSTGEPIASAGDTGGLEEAALYFEIRHNGEPRDPRQWCRRA
jgi:septal ring factor EnvC (AmiA/AmiB activator)